MTFSKNIKTNPRVFLLGFLSIASFCLSSCSSFKTAFIEQVEAQSQPIDIEIQVGDGHRYIDIDDPYCYTLESENDLTTLTIYEDAVLLFTKQFAGTVNQHFQSKSVFVLYDSFFLALNRWEGTHAFTDILKLSKTGAETILLSKSFSLDLEVWLYVDSFDDTFYISYNEKEESLNHFFFDRYLYQEGALALFENHISAAELYKGIKNILHTSDEEVVICTAHGSVYSRGGFGTSHGSGNIFFGEDEHIYMYTSDWEAFGDSYSIQLLDFTSDTHAGIMHFDHLSNGIHSSIFSYNDIGVFLFYPRIGDYSPRKSFVSIVVYDYLSESLYSYEMDAALVSITSIACYGKRLYFTSESREGAIVENLIDLSQFQF